MFPSGIVGDMKATDNFKAIAADPTAAPGYRNIAAVLVEFEISSEEFAEVSRMARRSTNMCSEGRPSDHFRTACQELRGRR